LTVGSLFSGIGGFDLGLERAGMVIKWQVEIDDFCNKVLEKHWPKVNRYRDIKELRGDELEPVDLICGGFPCQPFSAAGKQRSKEDDRYLWPEMLRIIRAVRPNWIIGENVAGIVSLALDDVLSDLENEGYACQSFIIPACAVNAPHRRDRVWIIGNAKHYGQPSSEERASGAARNRNASGEEEVCKPEGSGGAWGIPSDHEIRWQLQQEGALEEQRGWLSNSYKQASSDTESTGTWLDKRRLWRLPEQTDQPDPAPDPYCPGLQTEGTAQQTTGAFEYGNMAEGGLYWKPTDTERWDTSWIPIAADFCRMDNGVSAGMDRSGRKNYRAKRLKALGNAIVPQIVEIIGRAIIETEKG
jgi:DNA (cytosine-5)-methyltransferase 1